MSSAGERSDARGGRAPKSASAFRTISEVADELDVAQHVLRFWESKFPQVHPLKRGGGRRYYRPEDIEILRQIRSLLYDEGYTIKGAQKLLRTNKRRGSNGDAGETAGPTAGPTAKVAAVEAPASAAGPDVHERLQGLRRELDDLRQLLRRART